MADFVSRLLSNTLGGFGLTDTDMITLDYIIFELSQWNINNQIKTMYQINLIVKHV